MSGIYLSGNAGAVPSDPPATIGLNSIISRIAPGYKRNGKSNNERPGTDGFFIAVVIDIISPISYDCFFDVKRG